MDNTPNSFQLEQKRLFRIQLYIIIGYIIGVGLVAGVALHFNNPYKTSRSNPVSAKSIATLDSYGVTALRSGSTIPADYIFQIKLTRPSPQRHLELRTLPAIPTQASNTDTLYSWKPSTLLPQGEKLSIEIYDSDTGTSLFKTTVLIALKPKTNRALTNTTHSDSNHTLAADDTSKISTHRLNVPYYTQQYKASCTGAALRMILAYRGIYQDDRAIIERMGYKPSSMDKSQSPYRWDDPSLMFVGSIDGSIAAGTAAGPDAPPVAKAARSYGREATVEYGMSMADIAHAVYAGNPVIEFGASSDAGVVRWQTPSGRITVMHLASHVRVITGVYGTPNKPIGFWVSDPLGGGSRYWSAENLTADMNRDPYGQAVVVY